MSCVMTSGAYGANGITREKRSNGVFTCWIHKPARTFQHEVTKFPETARRKSGFGQRASRLRRSRLTPQEPVINHEVMDRPARSTAAGTPAQAGREFKVLQSSRAPAQLSLFPRSGAIDVK